MQYLHEHNIHDLPSSERPKCHQNIQNMALRATLTPQCMDVCIGINHHPRLQPAIHAMEKDGLSIPKKPDDHPMRPLELIQTFPDYFKFNCKNRTKINRMLGNAVPPLMAKHIAMHLLGRNRNGTQRNRTLNGTEFYFKQSEKSAGFTNNQYLNVKTYPLKGQTGFTFTITSGTHNVTGFR